MAKKLYGTDPDQVPTNADLGTIAYQDKDNLAVGEVYSDNQTIVSTKSTNAFSVTTNTGSNVALSIGGSSTINGVTSGTQAFYIMNVARDSGSGKSTYFNGNIGFPNGYGIDFSATSGTGTSELLDDYEEGTWTPVIKVGTTTNSGTLGNARYIKIGGMVTVYFEVYSITKSGTGSLTIEGLPYACGENSRYGAPFATRYAGISGGFPIPLIQTFASNFQIQLFDTGSNGYAGAVQDGNLSSTYNLYSMGMTYFTI